MALPDIDPAAGLTIQQARTVTKLEVPRLDALPIGVIRTDREGAIRSYNAAEAQLSGLSADDVVGKNFFTEVAPCTNVREFAGRFREGIEAGKLYEVFPYTFTFDPDPATVLVTLYYASPDPDAWIFVSVSR